MKLLIPPGPPDQAALLAGVPRDADEIIACGARPTRSGQNRPDIWLCCAAAGLCVLAGAAAAVSFTAQYRLVYAARRLALAAGLEAAIPDAAALVFACLGVALALHGRRAVRARALNVASAGASVFMNVIGAAPGWRDLAVWAMPPAAYALAGFRAWVLEECPVAPGRRASRPAPAAASSHPRQVAAAPRQARGLRGRTKTARFLALVAERHGPLAAIPLEKVAKISTAVALEVDLNAGAARAALRRAVLAARDGEPR
jgi:hypothetical protein